MSLSYIPRVTQLDAVLLDEQVEELFKQLILHAAKYLEPGVLQPVLPEIELILRTWIFKYSIYDKKSTFGQNMLSLCYKTENFTRSKMFWYYGHTVVLKYFKERMIYSLTSNTNLQRLVYKLELFQLFSDIFNFLRFIQTGKYPVLMDFILGLELTADKLTREDLTDFAWTRELLWHNLIELIGTTISLMNIFGLRRKLSKMLKYAWYKKHTYSPVAGQPVVMTVHTLCVCCANKPIIPYTMGCPHIFCYYCLMANKMADENYSCPKCYFNGKEMKMFVIS